MPGLKAAAIVLKWLQCAQSELATQERNLTFGKCSDRVALDV